MGADRDADRNLELAYPVDRIPDTYPGGHRNITETYGDAHSYADFHPDRH